MQKEKSENKENEKPKFPTNQCFAALVCNLAAINSGLGIGWVSTAIPQMRADGGLLTTLEPDEANTLAYWIAGIFPLAALISTPLVTVVMETRGRQFCGILTAIPFMVNSIIIIVTNNAYHILIGRLIMGCGIAFGLINTPTFVGEISETRVRGVLSAAMTLGYTVGLTLSYIIGGFISYQACALTMLIFGILNLVLFFFVPETPSWLVRNGQVEEAIKSIAWLRKIDVNDPIVQKEMKILQDSANDEPSSKLQSAKQMIHSKPLRRGFLLSVMTLTIQSLMGMIAVHSYSVTIFMQSGTANLTPEGAASIYGSIQIMGAISATFLVEQAGRKILMVGSSLCVAFFMFSMGTYFYLQSQEVDLTMVQWVPVASLTLCVYTYTVGAASIPFVLLSDLLTNEVRGFATMFVVQISMFNSFLTLRFFSPAAIYFGIHIVFFFFGSCSAIGGLLTILLLPETKGKSTEEIQRILSK